MTEGRQFPIEECDDARLGRMKHEIANPVVAVHQRGGVVRGYVLRQPSDQTLRGKWWESFNDSQLNTLEEQIDPANQTLKAAEADFRAARATTPDSPSRWS